MNSSGGDDPALRVAPADQRLDAEQLSARQRADRLVEQEQLLGVDRGAQVGFQRRAALRLVHPRVVEHVTVLPGRLRGVERQVGVAQQRVGARVAAERHADARRHRDRLGAVAERHRLPQDLGQAVGEHARASASPAAQLAQHDELVAAETADRVLCPYGAPQPLRHGAEQQIARRVSQVVVDRLEVVDVDEQHAGEHPGVARRAREQLLGAVEHERAVGQARQRVVQSLVGELPVLLGELAQRTHPTRGERQHQQADRQAQEAPAEQHRERVPVGEDAA